MGGGSCITKLLLMNGQWTFFAYEILLMGLHLKINRLTSLQNHLLFLDV